MITLHAMDEVVICVRPEMGCGNSKAVSTARETTSSSIKTNTRRESTSKSRPVTRGGDSIDIAVFGANDNSDVPLDSVDNAKPRLAHSGIRKTSNLVQGPITPSIESQEDSKRIAPAKDSSERIKEAFETVEFDDNYNEIFGRSEEQSNRIHSSQFQGRRKSMPSQSPKTSSKDNELILQLKASTGDEDDVSLDSFFNETNTMKTINNHNMSSASIHLPLDDTKGDVSPFNTSRTNLTGSRASSSKAGSILTTTALNTSIVTSYDGEEFFPELSVGTPHTSTSDYDSLTFRTMSITPSVHSSMEATPITLNKNFGTIVEEYEGGFTPRSIQNGDAKGNQTPLKKFTAREVLRHNKYVEWNQWTIYKSKVYDNKILKEIFVPLVNDVRAKREAEKEELKKNSDTKNTRELHEDDYDDFDDSSSYFSDYNDDMFASDNLENMMTWNTNGIRLVLRNGLEKEVVEAHIPQACVGSLCGPHDREYWEDIQTDIKIVLDDLIRADAKDALSEYMAEYMHLLQRWIKAYRHLHPGETKIPEGDPNEHKFPLPDSVGENPDCLRAWLENWVTFDLEVPENGAWTMLELEDIDLGDAHEIFAATLKAHVNLTPLDTEIEGEAGWGVIQEGLFADDVMTEQQKRTEQERKGRTDLHDPKRMKRRRHQILQYFIKKYEYQKSDVGHFIEWAEEMERGEKKFLSLC